MADELISVAQAFRRCLGRVWNPPLQCADGRGRRENGSVVSVGMRRYEHPRVLMEKGFNGFRSCAAE
jgi:hypothetical protein